jgi:uncharacterized peroxidase-related enzyme
MAEFTVHTMDSAPEESKEVLGAAKNDYGFIPNLLRVLAVSPHALKAYWTLGEQLNRTSLTAIEQQVLMLAVSRVNRCPYCMAAHTLTARLAGMPDADIESIRSGKPVSDAKLEALRVFTRAMTRKRGTLDKEEIAAFLAAGYTGAQTMEVILGIAYKTMSNYTNHIVGTLLDEEFRQGEWRPPEAK